MGARRRGTGSGEVRAESEEMLTRTISGGGKEKTEVVDVYWRGSATGGGDWERR